MSSAGDQIKAALRLIGQLAEGETASPETMADALEAFNQMLDSWSTERLAVFSTQDQVFTWPANTAARTIGPTGDFIGNRPVSLDDSTYFKDPSNGISYGIRIINQDQYDAISLKTVTTTYPKVIWLNASMPNIGMTIYPISTRALEWHFISVEELSQPAVLATDLVFPPGYKRAFKYCLACEIAAEFGVEAPASVQRIAMASKRNIKRINNPGDIMSMPYAIGGGKSRYNIYSDGGG